MWWRNRAFDETNFTYFKLVQELPFAAASIGQVHRAKIVENGVEKTVVVKVQVSEIKIFWIVFWGLESDSNYKMHTKSILG